MNSNASRLNNQFGGAYKDDVLILGGAKIVIKMQDYHLYKQLIEIL